jgi:hypothetical protein
MNLNPARVRLIAHPPDSAGPYQGHQLIMEPNDQPSRADRSSECPRSQSAAVNSASRDVG